MPMRRMSTVNKRNAFDRDVDEIKNAKQQFIKIAKTQEQIKAPKDLIAEQIEKNK